MTPEQAKEKCRKVNRDLLCHHYSLPTEWSVVDCGTGESWGYSDISEDEAWIDAFHRLPPQEREGEPGIRECVFCGCKWNDPRVTECPACRDDISNQAQPEAIEGPKEFDKWYQQNYDFVHQEYLRQDDDKDVYIFSRAAWNAAKQSLPVGEPLSVDVLEAIVAEHMGSNTDAVYGGKLTAAFINTANEIATRARRSSAPSEEMPREFIGDEELSIYTRNVLSGFVRKLGEELLALRKWAKERR